MKLNILKYVLSLLTVQIVILINLITVKDLFKNHGYIRSRYFVRCGIRVKDKKSGKKCWLY